MKLVIPFFISLKVLASLMLTLRVERLGNRQHCVVCVLVEMLPPYKATGTSCHTGNGSPTRKRSLGC